MTRNRNQALLPVKQRLSYAAGSVGAGIYSTVPGLLLLYYMTQGIGLPLAMASMVVLLPKLLVVIVDPLIGSFSDQFQSRWGRRRPFLFAGALLSGISFIALFSAPTFASDLQTATFLGLLYFIASFSYSIFAVPYVAMPAEMSRDPSTQSNIIGLRMMFVFLGVLAGAALAPSLVEQFGSGRSAYMKMAVILAALSAATMFVSASFSPDPTIDQPNRNAIALDTFMQLISYKPFAFSLLVYAIAICAMATASAAAPYFVVFALDRPEGDIAIIFLVQICTCLVTMMIWSKFIPIVGAGVALGSACLTAALGSLGFSILGSDSTTAEIAVVSAANGIGVAGIQVAAFALLAQMTNRLNFELDVRNEGAIAGLWTAIEKAALSVGPTVCAIVLSYGSFVANVDRSALSDESIRSTAVAISWAPALILLAAGTLIFFNKGLVNTTSYQAAPQ